MTRFNLLPDPRFEALKETLRERVRAAADAVDASNFGDLFDGAMRNVLHSSFAAARAHEGTVWIAERGAGGQIESLVPAYNTGPNAARMLAEVRQPLSRGIVSSVFAYEQPFCENDVWKNEKHDPSVDRALGGRTQAMIAVPLYFAGSARGIISCVQLTGTGAARAPGFSMDDLRSVQLASEVITRLVDHRLISATVAWDAE